MVPGSQATPVLNRQYGFSPDGRSIAIAVSWRRIPPEVWWLDQATGRELLHGTAPGQTITDVTVSPNGRYVAAACVDLNPIVVVWDCVSGRERIVLRGHADRITSLAFTPDSRRIASASKDGTVRVWTIDPNDM